MFSFFTKKKSDSSKIRLYFSLFFCKLILGERMKKGFTLIELIITIGLIAIIGVVLVSNMSAVFTNQQDVQYENFKKTIENAACTYIDLDIGASLRDTCLRNGSCYVRVSALLSAGYIEESDLVNPKTQSSISTSTNIQIRYTDGIKSCTYPE